jgi:hypothetical protein
MTRAAGTEIGAYEIVLPRYLPTGHIVYAVGGVLFAVPFDARRLETLKTRPPVKSNSWMTPWP